MLLFQFPEWSEDLKDWNREMHFKCTYNGVQLSETEFPKNRLTDRRYSDKDPISFLPRSDSFSGEPSF